MRYFNLLLSIVVGFVVFTDLVFALVKIDVPKSITVGEKVKIDASASTGSIESYRWFINDALQVCLRPICYFTFNDVGKYEITLMIRGDEGTQSVSIKLHVNPVLQAEISVPKSITIGERVKIDGSASTGNIETYRWFIDGELIACSDPICEFTFNEIGTYIIELEVSDKNGQASFISQKVVVMEPPSLPVAVAQVSYENSVVPLNIRLDGSHSKGNIVNYEWTTSNQTFFGSQVNLFIEKAGTHQITLTVTDQNAFTDTTQLTVIIVEPTQSPLAIVPTNHFFIENSSNLEDKQTKRPNDPNFDELWALHNTGQSGGKKGVDIGATKAWTITTGEPVVCAVLDSGVDYNHPDLKNNIWHNQVELNGIEGVDDDNNGFIDDIYGWDFINNDNDPSDECGHGTQVAGIIAATGNNSTGVTGVNWAAKIMALRIAKLKPLPRGGIPPCVPSNQAVIAALKYARSMGVKCFNMSWGGSSDDKELANAIEAASEALFIAAAGNNGQNNDEMPYYPASYPLDNIISVCASDQKDRLAFLSNMGMESVDLCAPGTRILSTSLDNGYIDNNGTSMATAYVSGAVTLLWSIFPNLTALEIKQHLMQSVVYAPLLLGTNHTNGRLNVYNALTTTQSQHQTFTISNSSQNDVNINQIQITGQDATEFAYHDNTCLSQPLAAGNTCTIDVLFVPTSLGDKQAVLEVVSDTSQTLMAQLNGHKDDDFSGSTVTILPSEFPVLERAEPAIYSLETGELEISTVIVPNAKGSTDVFRTKLCLIGNNPLRFNLCGDLTFVETRYKILGDTTYDAVTGIINIPGIEVGTDSGVFYEVDMQISSNPEGDLEFEVIKLIPIH